MIVSKRDEDRNKDNHKNAVPTLHFYDSYYGTPYGGGTLFTYSQPYFNYTSYRVQSVTITNFIGFGNVDVFYLCSSIVGGSIANFRNGLANSIVASIPRKTTLGPCIFEDIRSPTIWCSKTMLQTIQFKLVDQDFNTINTRFYVTLKINTII